MTALFAAGLLLVVAPYTARNYAVTGRFIPVNAQAGIALWATSLERIPSGENYLHWVNMWSASAMKTFTEVTGARRTTPSPCSRTTCWSWAIAFVVIAGDNLRRDPTVYAYNASHNGVRFLVDPPTSFFFAAYAWPRYAGAARFVAGLSVSLMTVIGVIALVIGCVRRDPRWTLVLALFAMMWAAHALTFLEARYLYIKLPTIMAAFVLACIAGSADGRASWRLGAVSVATLAAVLSIAGLFVAVAPGESHVAAIRTDPANSRNPGTCSNTLPAPPDDADEGSRSGWMQPVERGDDDVRKSGPLELPPQRPSERWRFHLVTHTGTSCGTCVPSTPADSAGWARQTRCARPAPGVVWQVAMAAGMSR